MNSNFGHHGLTERQVQKFKKNYLTSIFSSKKRGQEDQFWSTWTERTISSDFLRKIISNRYFQAKKKAMKTNFGQHGLTGR